MQEQASPTKSSEEAEGEEEQDLEELDPVALQKKVGRGAVAWGIHGNVVGSCGLDCKSRQNR